MVWEIDKTMPVSEFNEWVEFLAKIEPKAAE